MHLKNNLAYSFKYITPIYEKNPKAFNKCFGVLCGNKNLTFTFV